MAAGRLSVSPGSINDDVNIIRETKIISVPLGETVIWVLRAGTIHFRKSMAGPGTAWVRVSTG